MYVLSFNQYSINEHFDFKKWFDGSVIKHPSGKPMKLDHGSDFKFKKFQVNRDGAFPDAVYFTSNKRLAQTYGKYLYTVYLNIKDPYYTDAEGKTFNNYYEKFISVVDTAINGGHDGVIVRNFRDDRAQISNRGSIGTTYVVFSPRQIKIVSDK